MIATRSSHGLFAVTAAATVGYIALSRLVRKGKTRASDATAREEVLTHVSARAKRLAEATGHIGTWYTHVPLAAGALALLARDRRLVAGATIASASLASTALSRVLDHVHDRRTPPPGKTRIDPDAQSYPSGHALETTAVALASAWVLAREAIVPVAVAMPVAVLASAISGLGRLVLDRHWSTDSAAGYCAGIALGTACAGSYELARGRR